MHRKNCVVCGVPVHSAPVSQLIPSHLSTVHWSQLVTLCDTLLLMPVRTLFLFPQPLPEAHVLPPDLTQAARSVTSVPPVLAWAVAVPPAVLGPGARPFWGARGCRRCSLPRGRHLPEVSLPAGLGLWFGEGVPDAVVLTSRPGSVPPA